MDSEKLCQFGWNEPDAVKSEFFLNSIQQES